ncbi:ribonuclease HI [Nitratiruptor sp. YY09-18]|uniref:ribonuclease HI n=1 Tax=Nitratiruptor sp. YY09-18 TaxID=2724901 RepID=UPI0019162D9B|nr:ribonuclease HI [Nitratiruptor sp. YY09-18]BCD67349.1 ribonuclease HI [Nitratiruptor sp. YY09-18]
MKRVLLFSDGSSLGNPGPGGYCAILRYKDTEKVISGGEPHTTNNRMELRAVIEGLKALKEPCVVDIYSDSNYVVQAINQWLAGWIKKDFKNVKNPDLWKEFLEVAKPHKIRAFWVKGHAGHEENERCDKIARQMAQNQKA